MFCHGPHFSLRIMAALDISQTTESSLPLPLFCSLCFSIPLFPSFSLSLSPSPALPYSSAHLRLAAKHSAVAMAAWRAERWRSAAKTSLSWIQMCHICRLWKEQTAIARQKQKTKQTPPTHNMLQNPHGPNEKITGKNIVGLFGKTTLHTVVGFVLSITFILGLRGG